MDAIQPYQTYRSVMNMLATITLRTQQKPNNIVKPSNQQNNKYKTHIGKLDRTKTIQFNWINLLLFYLYCPGEKEEDWSVEIG